MKERTKKDNGIEKEAHAEGHGATDPQNTSSVVSALNSFSANAVSPADKSLRADSQDLVKKLINNSNKIFKVFGVNYASQQTALAILRKLAEGMPQSIIPNKLPFSLSVINYWASKFLKDRLIREKGHGKPRIFELTSFGTKVLTRCERGLDEPIVMEDYPMKFRLMSDAGRVDWQKLGEPNNWVKMGFKVDGIRVEKNCGDVQTIIIHTGQLSGFDPDALLLEAGIIIGLVRARLQDLGVVTDEVGFPIRKPWFKEYTPEAEILNRSGTVVTHDGQIDHSPPDKDDSHEEREYEQQKNYLAIPRRIEQQSRDVAELKAQLSGLTEVVSKQNDLLSGILNVTNKIASILEDTSQPRSLPLPKNDRSVV